MTREEVANLVGEFTWDFGQEFFIETKQGNFVWSDPDYNGSGELRPYSGSYDKWIKRGMGRSKGLHRIGDYCGDFLWPTSSNTDINR